MKKLFTILISLLSITAYAQNEQRSGTFDAGLSFGVSGDYVYHCTYNDIGEKILNGPFTINGDLTMDNIRINYRTSGSATVRYRLSGSHNMGCLNGPLQMSASVKAKLSNGKTQTDTYSFKGNFKSGYPNGNFVVNYKEGNLVRIANVTYKDSIFVGTYHCKGLDDNSWEYEYKGAFTPEGKLTGTWSLNKNAYQFINGVKVSGYGGELTDMAKKYAAGSISKEQLSEKGLYVCTDSLDLGYRAWDIILSDEIHWEKLGWYSFSKTRYIKYEYLKELVRISDHGVNKFVHNLKKVILSNDRSYSSNSDIELPMADSYKGLFEFASYVLYDKKYDEYYIQVWKKSSYADYCSGGSLAEALNDGSVTMNVYLTKAQYEKVAYEIHELQKQNVKTREEFRKLVYNISPEYFEYCQYDSNYAVYDCRGHKMRFYVDVDMAEEYMIQAKKFDYMLANAPELRKGIVSAKVEEALAVLLRDLKESLAKRLVNHIRNKRNDINAFHYDRTIVSYTGYEDSDYEKYFPIVAIRLGDFERNIDPDCPYAAYKAEFDFNVLKGNNDFKSYRTVLYADDKNRIIIEKTFDPSIVKSLPTPFDKIEELSDTIKNNNERIKLIAAENYPKSWNNIKAYINNHNLTKDYSDPRGSLNRYESLCLAQKEIMNYLQELSRIKTLYEEATKKSSASAEMLKQYETYISSVDFVWTIAAEIDKLKKVTSVQEKTLEYLAQIEMIDKLHPAILRSGFKQIIKPFSKWFEMKDLGWKVEYDYDYYNHIVSTVSDTYSITQKQSSLNHNVAKLKELRSASKIIYKLYSDYYNTIDLSWNENTGTLVKKYDELLYIQEECINILSSDKIGEISAEVSNSSMTDIMQVIDKKFI